MGVVVGVVCIVFLFGQVISRTLVVMVMVNRVTVDRIIRTILVSGCGLLELSHSSGL